MPGMPLHRVPLTVGSPLPPLALLARLRDLSARRRSAVVRGPLAQRAGVLAWDLREGPEGIALRPMLPGSGSYEPRFVGVVQARESGSILSGEVRVHWFGRVFSALLVGLSILLPLLAAVIPDRTRTPDQQFLVAGRMALLAFVIAPTGLWMQHRSLRSATAAIRELLEEAASPEGA